MFVRAIDLETTGMDPSLHKIVEIAAVDYHPEHKWVRQFGSRLVNPDGPIPPEASAIHHITDAMVADQESWDGVEKLFAGAPIYAAHNCRFEQSFLPWRGCRWIDTYRVALVLYPDAPGHSLQTLRYALDLPVVNDYGPPHRALPDAYICAVLLREMHKLIPIAEMIEISSRPALLSKLMFGKHRGARWQDVPRGYLEWIAKQPDMDEDVRHTALHWLKEVRE